MCRYVKPRPDNVVFKQIIIRTSVIVFFLGTWLLRGDKRTNLNIGNNTHRIGNIYRKHHFQWNIKKNKTGGKEQNPRVQNYYLADLNQDSIRGDIRFKQFSLV